MKEQLLKTLMAIDQGSNLVHLGDLRTAMKWERKQFDLVMWEARKAGLIVLASVEGRHGISDYDRAAMIVEGSDRLLYASKWVR